MTTSLQLAQECLREGLPEPSEPPQPLEGLEMFAQTIETGKQAWALLSTGQGAKIVSNMVATFLPRLAGTCLASQCPT